MYKNTLPSKTGIVGVLCVFFMVLFMASCTSDQEQIVPERERVEQTEDTVYAEYDDDLDVVLVFEEFDWWLLEDFERNSLLRDGYEVSPFYGETLLILVSRDWSNQHNLGLLASGFERMHPGVTVQFIFEDAVGIDAYNTDEIDALVAEMMYEYAPILIQASTVMYPNLEHFGLFADWLPVLEMHPGFNEVDWNMNVLSASLINGELIGFPTFQPVFFATANRNVPGLASRFLFRDGITIHELMDLYDEFWGYGAGYAFWELDITWTFIYYLLHDFFCYVTGRVEFDSEEFILLLERMRYSVAMLDIEIFAAIQNQFDVDEEMSGLSFFRWNQAFWSLEMLSIFENEPYFINPLPIVTRDGALTSIIGNGRYTWVLGSQDPVSQALAADFLLYMAGVFGMGVDSRNSPFYAHRGIWGWFGVPARVGAYAHAEYLITRFQWWFPQAVLRYDIDYAVSRVMEYVQLLEGMEIRRHGVMPFSLFEYVMEELQEFAQGTVSARETSMRLQTRALMAIR